MWDKAEPAFLAVQMERLTVALRENTCAMRENTLAQMRGTTATNRLSEETYDMAEKIEDWEKTLLEDTDATNAMTAAVDRWAAQVEALNIPDPRLTALMEGFKANTARTFALAARNTPAAPPNPEPLPPAVPVVDPTTGQPFPEPTA
jgi:hypothetical protein